MCNFFVCMHAVVFVCVRLCVYLVALSLFPFNSIQCEWLELSLREWCENVCSSPDWLCVFMVTNFPNMNMWPIVSGKSSFLIWNTKSHKFRCRQHSTKERERCMNLLFGITANPRTNAALETKANTLHCIRYKRSVWTKMKMKMETS